MDLRRHKQGNVLLYGLVFAALFLVGGLISLASLPEFPGRFYIGGLVLGIFGTGAGTLIVHAFFGN